MKNPSKIDPKLPAKMECINFGPFCTKIEVPRPPRHPQTPPREAKKHCFSLVFSRFLLSHASLEPPWLNMATPTPTKLPKTHPRRTQDAPRRPKTPTRRPKTTQDAPKTLQKQLKMLPRRFRIAPRRFQDVPRRPKTVPRRSKAPPEPSTRRF